MCFIFNNWKSQQLEFLFLVEYDSSYRSLSVIENHISFNLKWLKVDNKRTVSKSIITIFVFYAFNLLDYAVGKFIYCNISYFFTKIQKLKI